MIRRALASAVIVIAACAPSASAPPSSSAPPVRSSSTTPAVATVAPRSPRLRPDPMKATIAWAGTALDAPLLRVDPRGVRGELPKLGQDARGDALLDLAGYGADAEQRMRVFVAPALAPGETLDARRRLLLVSADAGEGHFRAVEGDDDGYWDGAPAFDPRAVFAELAGVRTALRERYKLAGSHAIYTYLFSTPVERPVGRFHLDRVPGAMLLEVSPAEPYTTAIRVSLAAALVQEMWDLVRAPRVAESEWFGFGIARACARELLRRFGTLAAKDVADDVSTMTATLAEGAAHVPAERRALAGDRLGFDLARALEGKGGLLALVDALFADARAGKASFDGNELMTRIAAKLAPASVAALASGVDPKPPPFRAARFVCFDAAPRKVVDYTFPFAWESSRAAGRVLAPVSGAPVREGEKILQLEAKADAMKLVVERDGAPVTLAITGVKSELTIGVFAPRADVSDAACREAP